MVFTTEEFTTAEEKAKILNDWDRFFQSGFALSRFTKRLYHHLTLHCSFIAHYNLHGFYAEYFEPMGEATVRFIDQFDPDRPGISAEYGATWWIQEGQSCSDLNRAMREVFTTAHVRKARELVRSKMLAIAQADADAAVKRIASLRK